ncbi:MAG TPA: glycine oxidase ThiO [Vulgatibacter sp.]|nr:glycine oxidase ThiO [Vulgatibacter sp.]
MVYDGVVIGGGVMGSAVALRLAQAGQRVLVLEKSIPGAEASSAAGGILGPQMEGEHDDALFRLALASRDAYPAFASELRELSGVDVGWRRCGLLRTCAAGEDVAPLEERLAWQRRAGLPIETLGGDEVRRLEPSLSPAIERALHFPEEAVVEPRKLAEALPIAAQAAGASVRRAQVRRIVAADGRAVGVELDDGVVSAGAVVVAAGAWTSKVEGSGLPCDAVRPVRGQMAALRGAGPSPSRIVFTSRGYLVPRADGTVVAGSTMEEVGYEKRVTAGGLARILGNAADVMPSLAHAEVAATWSGLRPCPRDGLPLIGAGPLPGLFLASGHHRNGILLTPETARLLARAVVDGRDPDELAPFSPMRYAR